MAKRLFIKSYGCQMNVYDAGRMADVMAVHGYARTDRADEAEVTVLNTCHIREKAAEKLFSDLGRLRRPPRSSMPGILRCRAFPSVRRGGLTADYSTNHSDGTFSRRRRNALRRPAPAMRRGRTRRPAATKT